VSTVSGYTQGMTYYETFKDALERELPVVAHVRLYDGQERIRVGPVANLNQSHVTIFDMNPTTNLREVKGFRTTPLGLVLSVTIQEPRTTWLGRAFKRLLEVFK